MEPHNYSHIPILIIQSIMRKTIKSACIYVCMALLVCGLAGLNSCNPDEAKAPATPATPTGLNVSDLKDVYAVLAWDGEAPIYEVSIDGAEPKAVTSKTYKATDLTAETGYAWKVRAKADGLYSEWVDGPAFTTEPPIIEPVEPDRPTTLTVTDVTATSAVFAWEGTAESFEIEVGGVSEIVDAKTFTASELTPETNYIWRVRAKSGDLYSDWVIGTVFTTTFAIPESIEFTHPFIFSYDADYYGPGTSNFSVILTTVDIDPAIDNTGWMISLDILSTQVNENNGSGYVNIPEGTYNFSTTVDAGNIILGTGAQTATLLARVLANANYVATSPITGGTVTIAGDHTDYSITMDVILADGTSVDCSYNGPIMIEAPEGLVFGELAAAEFDALGGGSIKNYTLRLSDKNKVDTDTGFMLTLDLYGIGDSKTIIPDGTYTYGASGAWRMDPGYTYCRWYENNLPKIYEVIKELTCTTTHTGDNTYTIEVHVVTESGIDVRRTYSGEVTIAYGA